MDISKLLFALIRCELKGEELSTDSVSSLDENSLKKLYSLSKMHDISHLLYNPIIKYKPELKENETVRKFQKKQMLSVFQVSQLEYETKRICSLLDRKQIPYIKLKGANIRGLYPEPWMRTSCDIDILVKEDSLKNAVDYLIKEGEFEKRGEPDYHDVSLYSKNEIQLELHFSIKENIDNIDSTLEKVWNYAERKDMNTYEYVLSNEFFMFHIISHMAYHFLSGGCGIRPFIDLWFLENKIKYDKRILDELLNKCSLNTFYNEAKLLSEAWMENKAYDETLERMTAFILSGGSFGTRENAISLRSSESNSKLSYMFHRLFPPLRVLKIRYPVLKKLPFLIPVFWIIRIFASSKGKKKDDALYELKATIDRDEVKNTEMTDLMNKLDLK